MHDMLFIKWHVSLTDFASMLYSTFILTPDLQQVLNLNKSSGITKQGLSAGETGKSQPLIELNDVTLCCGDFSSGESSFPLKGPLHAIVTDFPQEQ